MKLNFVSFQGVHSDFRSWGMVRIMEPISDEIKCLHRYYVSHSPKGYKKFYQVSQIHKILSRLIWSLGTRFKVNVGLLRYIQELSFDFSLSKKIQFPCILVSTAYIPRTARNNAEAGGFNIFIAGNPYDRWISSILENESIKNQVKIKNAYTFEPRLKFIDDFMLNQQEIISQSLVTHESLQGRFSNTKKTLINYELLPDQHLFPDLLVRKREIFTFIYVASTVWLKGLTYLIEAWRSLGNIGARLIVVGPIYQDVLKVIMNQIPQSIEAIGFVPAQKLNDLYRSCHVCIVPSLADDHPATIAEAMHCGLPVIATRECGSHVLINDGETGFVVPSADFVALANKIQWCAQHFDIVSEMGHKAKISIKKLDNKSQATNIARYIQKNVNQIIK
jgi:glycosyltransferase involved in cell wall biosynthesis